MTQSTTANPPISPALRRELRARAHHLEPVVMIGDAGLSAAVLAETDRALKAHELIKVRVFGDDREQRLAYLATLCAELGCQPVQHIGKLLVVYRKRPTPEARVHVPKKRLASGAKAAKPTRKPAAKPARAAAKPAARPGAKPPAAKPAAKRGVKSTRSAGDASPARRRAPYSAARPSASGPPSGRRARTGR